MADKPTPVSENPNKDYFKMAEMPVSSSKVFEQSSQQCRICLQSLEKNEVPGICRCKGNASVAHKLCLIEWVKKADQLNQYLSESYSICDICKAPIFLETQNKMKCINLDEFTFVKKESYCTVAIFILFFVSIVGFGVCIYGFSKNENDEDVRKIFMIGLIISAVILFLDLCAYLIQILVKFETQIIGFKTLKDVKIQNNKLKKSKTIPVLEINSQSQNESSITSIHQIPLE